MVLILLPFVSVVRCLFLASSSRFLRSYVTFSAALFFDFAVLLLQLHTGSVIRNTVTALQRESEMILHRFQTSTSALNWQLVIE